MSPSQSADSITVTCGQHTANGRAHGEQEKALTVARFDLKFKNITLSMRLCLVNLSRCTASCLENTSVLLFGFYHRCTGSTSSAAFGHLEDQF